MNNFIYKKEIVKHLGVPMIQKTFLGKKLNPYPENIKIVRIAGGIGNQMFMYAFGKALEKKYGHKVYFDKSNYKALWETEINNSGKNLDGLCIRHYELDIFDHGAEFVPEELILSFKKNCLDFTVPYSKSMRKNSSFKLYIEPKFNVYDDKAFEIAGNVCYESYFQAEKYLEGIEEELKRIFILPPLKENDDYNKALVDKVNSFENSVFVHVRREDYIRYQCTIDNKYYKNAAKYIADRLENPKFFVFCAEDEDYIKNEFDMGYPFELIGTKNKNEETFYENMRLMMLCKHGILANSSYCWWAAWLSDFEGKIVIAPNPWMPGQESDIICKKWVKIDR